MVRVFLLRVRESAGDDAVDGARRRRDDDRVRHARAVAEHVGLVPAEPLFVGPRAVRHRDQEKRRRIHQLGPRGLELADALEEEAKRLGRARLGETQDDVVGKEAFLAHRPFLAVVARVRPQTQQVVERGLGRRVREGVGDHRRRVRGPPVGDAAVERRARGVLAVLRPLLGSHAVVAHELLPRELRRRRAVGDPDGRFRVGQRAGADGDVDDRRGLGGPREERVERGDSVPRHAVPEQDGVLPAERVEGVAVAAEVGHVGATRPVEARRFVGDRPLHGARRRDGLRLRLLRRGAGGDEEDTKRAHRCRVCSSLRLLTA
mmetsp:Transcript_29080/g.95159  ORF Transcript_29080/g.95159 Transcript_29080/m.95159 type:complete len:319 (-) Transcript_29080:43-999(-)